MSGYSAEPKRYFPSSRAGLLAGVELVAAALIVTAAQAAGSWPVASSVTFILLLAFAAVGPRGISAKGTGLRAPISQRRSGWIYVGVLAVGLIFIAATLATGQPVWALAAGLIVAVAAVTAVVAILFASNRRPEG